MENSSTLFTPGSDTLGKTLEVPDFFMEDQRWKVPKELLPYPVQLRGEIMYAVHAILENITVSKSQMQEVVTDLLKLLEYPGAWNYYFEQTILRNKGGTH